MQFTYRVELNVKNALRCDRRMKRALHFCAFLGWFCGGLHSITYRHLHWDTSTNLWRWHIVTYQRFWNCKGDFCNELRLEVAIFTWYIDVVHCGIEQRSFISQKAKCFFWGGNKRAGWSIFLVKYWVMEFKLLVVVLSPKNAILETNYWLVYFIFLLLRAWQKPGT